MKTNYAVLVVSLVALTLLMPVLAHAQDATITELNKIIKAKVDEINAWDALAQMLALLTLAVAILGAISGIMSQVTAGWAKIAIAVAGGCIAIITAFINIRYPVDYRTYKKLTLDARMIVNDINMQIAHLPAIADTNERREIIEKNIWPKLQKVTDIGKQLVHSGNGGMPYGISTAYAQEATPSWLTTPPREKNTLYFVGHGVAKETGAAEHAAKEYTRETARLSIYDALVDSGQKIDDPNNPRIMASILEGSEIINTFVRYDAGQNTYRYFCLLKIDIETIQFRLQLLKAGEKIGTPGSFLNILRERSAP